MTTYWAILEKMSGSKLRLTRYDDEIHEHFKKEFPDFDLEGTIDEEEMKSKDGKEKWRNFIQQYEKKVEDYNFGTMVRANPAWEYGEKETIFGMCKCTAFIDSYVSDDHASCSNAVLCNRDCS